MPRAHLLSPLSKEATADEAIINFLQAPGRLDPSPQR